MKALLTAIVVMLWAGSACAAGVWTELARRDLDEIHRILLADHPGPVDPENPAYRKWLEDGLVQARARADATASFSDYKRVLQFYANGFRDGHMSVSFNIDSRDFVWPGFLPRMTDDGGFEVGVSEEAGAPLGAKILSCDGRPLAELMDERVLPYFWNRDIPHQRANHAPRLLMLDRGDRPARFKACDLEVGGARRTLALQWRVAAPDAAAALRRTALGRVTPARGLRQVDGVWFLSIPGFNIEPGPDTEAMHALLAEIEAKAPELRSSTLVIDVRGNTGGNSDWGVEIARRIWSPAWVERIGGSFDNTVDWRASPDNLKSLQDNMSRSRSQGLADGEKYYGEAAALVSAAMAKGEPLARQSEPGKPMTAPAPPNPVTGRVFFLTDGACFSACLDFADFVRRVPGVTHVGQPTAADAVYIDNTYADLPSSLAGLSYSLKVYRRRVRGNNEWYKPDVAWPGGPMTDEAVAAWIKMLPARHG